MEKQYLGHLIESKKVKSFFVASSKPFISKMTKSELTAVMVGGFATVAGQFFYLGTVAA